jgi:uncharacterized DUF497 family protein
MSSLIRRLSACTGFDWDDGNLGKNWVAHDVTDGESEEIFFNQPLIIATDTTHDKAEQRGYALGQTNRERWLFVAFTIRTMRDQIQRIRVISARDMTKRERRRYEQAK